MQEPKPHSKPRPKQKTPNSPGTSNRDDLAQLVENLQELHRWQGIILDNLSRIVQSGNISHTSD